MPGKQNKSLLVNANLYHCNKENGSTCCQQLKFQNILALFKQKKKNLRDITKLYQWTHTDKK